MLLLSDKVLKRKGVLAAAARPSPENDNEHEMDYTVNIAVLNNGTILFGLTVYSILNISHLAVTFLIWL